MQPKLVRDHIPQIIKNNGNHPIVKQVKGLELFEALRKKLVEEAEEVNQTFTQEELKDELADILEIVASIVEAEELDWDEIVEIKNDKAKNRGRFKQGYILEEIK